MRFSKVGAIGVLVGVLAALLPVSPAFASTPSEPLNPVVTVATDGLRLTWSRPADSGSGFSYFEVFRGDTPDSLTSVAMVDAQFLGYADPLSAQTRADHDYYYAVRTAQGTYSPASALSAVVSGHTPTAATSGTSTQVFTMNYNTSAGPNRTSLADTYLAPDLGVSVNQYTGELNIGGWHGNRVASLNLMPPTDGLSVGDFPVAATASPGVAAVRLMNELQGCQSTGMLHVHEFAIASNGTPAILDLDYTLRCPGAASDVVGSLRFHSTSAAFTGLHYAIPDGSTKQAVVGQVSQIPLTVTNAGTTPITFATPTLTADDFAFLTPLSEWAVDGGTCTTAPLAPDSSCQLGLTVSATASGVRAVVVHLPHDGPLGGNELQVKALAIAKPGRPTTTRNLSSADLVINWEQHDVDFDSLTDTWHIYRGPSVDALQEIGTTSRYTVQYQDSDLTDGVRYYAIQGENWAGLGPMSAPLRVVVGAAAPALPRAVSLARSVGFAWARPDAYSPHVITGYAVYSGPTSAVTTRTVQTGTATSTAPLPVGSRVYWQVAALYDDGTEGPRTALTSAVAGSSELITGGCGATSTLGGPVVPLRGIPVGWICSDGAVSRDGRWVAFSAMPTGASSKDIYIMPIDGSAAPTRIESMAGNESAPTWQPDGLMIAFEHYGNTVELFMVPSHGGTPGNYTGPTAYLREPSFIGTSRDVVVADYHSSTANLVRVGATSLSPIAGTAGGREPSSSPDGKKIAYVVPNPDSSSSLKVLTLGGTTMSFPLTGTAASPTWPDGSVVFFSEYSPYTDVWTARRLTVATKALSAIGPALRDLSVAQPDVTAPVVRFTAPTVTSTTATSVKVAWAATDLQAGVKTSDLRYRRAKGTGALSGYIVPSGWSATTAIYKTMSIAKGYRYCFSVRTRDKLNNTSAWTADRCLTAK